MPTVKEIFQHFESLIPTSLKMDFDNPGFLVGNGSRSVTKALLALEITDEVIQEAKKFGAELIVSHHPLFFSVTTATSEDLIGRKIVALLESGMSAICLHTNLDAVESGVNDALMAALNIPVEGILEPMGTTPNGTPYGMGRFGHIADMELNEFLAHCKQALGCNGIRYVSGGRPVRKVAVCGGSGSSMLKDVHALQCDTFVTGDVKHNGFLDAKELGINLIDAGHYSTENVVMPVLERIINEGFPQIETKISSVHKQPEQYYV